MNKAEYWILDSCVELRYPLTLLIHEQLEIHYNRKGHGLSYSELVETLNGLFQVGDLEILDYTNLSRSDENCQPVAFTPSRAEIELGLEPRIKDYYYGLTAQGGRKWEEVSKPNWNKYLDSTSWTEELNWIQQIVCGEKAIVTQLLQMKFETGIALRKPPVWELLSPWQATYWKTVPRGHSVTFRYENLSEDDHRLHIWQDAEVKLHKFMDEVSDWYTSPSFAE